MRPFPCGAGEGQDGGANVDIRYCCGLGSSVLLQPPASSPHSHACLSRCIHCARNDGLLYFGPEDAHWRVPVSAIKALGEFRSASTEDGHYLAIVIDTSGAWFQAPRRAVGMDQVLSDLARQWDTNLELSLDRAGSVTSRVLWPAYLAGEEMFELKADARRAASTLALRAELLRRLAIG
jgi:hypothetical protein